MSRKESKMKSGLRLFMTLCLAIALCGIAMGQETTGNIRGTVRDANGAAVPNATVTATNPQRSWTVTTDDQGVYEFQQLPPGDYVVSANASGFSETKREGVPVELGRTIQANIDLKVAGTAASVNVTTNEEPLVDVSSTKTATNVTQAEFDVLPKTLNFSSAINVAPGTRSEAKSNGFQIDGASGSENVFVVDGLDVTRLFGGTLGSSKNIPFDFVKEVQIKSAGYEAEFGGATGGVINVVTRSGSNEFHGEGRLEYQNDALIAHPNFVNRRQLTDTSKAQLFRPNEDKIRFFSPILSLGGPIVKNRLWFFSSWAPQYTRTRQQLDLISVTTGAAAEQLLSRREITYTNKNDYFITRFDATPWSKLTVNGVFINSPVKSGGPTTRVGTSNQTTSATTFNDTTFVTQGGFTPSWQLSTAVTYTPTSNLVIGFRAGRNYLNDKGTNYGIPIDTTRIDIQNACSATITAAVIGGLPCAAGTTSTGRPVINNNTLTVFDITKRTNLNWDASWVKRILGQQHVLKGGYQYSKLFNSIKSENSGGYLQFFFGQSVTEGGVRFGFDPASAANTSYGYYTTNIFGTEGTASSNNQAIFVQDQWQIHPRVTLNLGVRFEKEFLPAYPINLTNHPSLAAADLEERGDKLVSFGWSDKIAPRIGAAWDVNGDGKIKIYGSFSLFYDTMKYDLARASGGGEFWIQHYYTLNAPDFRATSLAAPTGTRFRGPIDLRLPSVSFGGDPPSIDPNLKPMREREYTVGADYAVSRDLLFGARLTRKQLDTAIDDVGIAIDGVGEFFTVANPGIGIGESFYKSPKALRNYTGLELRLDKRFSNNWYGNVSYIFSKLYGNYGGLASSDENGRANPNINRYFDDLALSYDNFGRLTNGRLPTDRPHTFKAFGSYRLNWMGMTTDFGVSQFLYQGIPVTTSIDIVVPGGAGFGVYPNGRGDLGRTDTFSQTDALINHRFKLNETATIKLGLNVFNLWDQRTETSRYTGTQDGRVNGFLISGQRVSYPNSTAYINGNGDIFTRAEAQHLIHDPRFNQPESFQGPRNARISVGIEF
jgi:carboxypeptidase family protein/TonB-dependent receptor-like protein